MIINYDFMVYKKKFRWKMTFTRKQIRAKLSKMGHFFEKLIEDVIFQFQ